MQVWTSKNVVKSVEQYEVVSYANANFLQLLLWERFGALSLMLIEFKLVKPRVVDRVEKVKSSLLK